MSKGLESRGDGLSIIHQAIWHSFYDVKAVSVMAVITCTESNIQTLQQQIRHCNTLLNYYKWLIDGFVLDFFSEKHWEKLPETLATALDQINLEELGCWMLTPPGTCLYRNHAYPLSLLALKALCQSLMLDRRAVSNLAGVSEYLREQSPDSREKEEATNDNISETIGYSGYDKKLNHVFCKHVKPKKQHEIVRLSETCAMMARATGCHDIIDAGAGVGHLSRHLAYCHGLKLYCLESQEQFKTQADKLDLELQSACERHGVRQHSKPIHVTIMLDSNTRNILEVVNAVNQEHAVTQVGLVGLHTCGDLGPTLIRNFANNPELQYLALVGCCYMKMNLSKPTSVQSFPMSKFVQSLDCSFASYEALEVSCHAIETYCDRLNEEDFDKLKVHCYRATLETLLVQLNPPLRRAGLRSVKRAHLLSFPEYCKQALHKIDVTIAEEEMMSEEIESCLSQWKRVVAFYTLRLMLAPVIETVRLSFYLSRYQDNLEHLIANLVF